MPAVTRRRCPDAREECWHIFYGNVRAGTIAIRKHVRRAGNPRPGAERLKRLSGCLKYALSNRLTTFKAQMPCTIEFEYSRLTGTSGGMLRGASAIVHILVRVQAGPPKWSAARMAPPLRRTNSIVTRPPARHARGRRRVNIMSPIAGFSDLIGPTVAWSNDEDC